MTDWALIIDRAIAGRTVSNFVTFKAQREFEARGETLKNPPQALGVEAMLENYLLDDSFSDVGSVEVAALCAKLIAALETQPATEWEGKLTNYCFDALACIRALEAQLAREHQRLCMLRESYQHARP